MILTVSVPFDSLAMWNYLRSALGALGFPAFGLVLVSAKNHGSKPVDRWRQETRPT